MINSRDSSNDYNPDNKELIEIPYSIGTILELKENPKILAKICHYRLFVENYKQKIYVGITTNIYEINNEIEKEISVEELLNKWKKPDRIVVAGKLDSENGINISGTNKDFKKLELNRKKKKKKS